MKELRSVDSSATQLERTNVLMKLRETLLDEGQGVSVTAPSGITVFPFNAAFALWGLASLVLACVFAVWLGIENY